MKTLNVILCELKKVIISPYFLIGVIAFALMCFSSSAYYDSSTMREKSIFEMIGMLGTKEAESYEFSAQHICTRGLGSWVIMFLGIIVSFPFVKILCDERKHSEKRSLIIRTGVLRYSLSKLVSSIISAAAITGIGYLLFAAAVHVIFPSISEFSESQQEMLTYSADFGKYYLCVVLIGMVVSVLPFLLCSVLRNHYFCICIPFLIQYMHSVIDAKIGYDTINSNEKILSEISAIIKPSTVFWLTADVKKGIYTLIFYLCLAVLSLLVFQLSQRRCVDVGQ